ncbi:hypothetical protein G6F68_007512 [Rhizopus microsporus]|nr:hypothetical protein G6F67_007941 [Rhizopus microsporus]KAG1260336.1 hypothetical protein G6F68_007512 [Rhizopus microsporus]
MADLQDDLDFDDLEDDIDMEELVAAAETVEQEHGVRNGQISFVSNEDDPIPPAPLPEDTPSFHPLDVNNLCTWIYPINYPVRGYQLNIVQKALFNNTLVALPTGLGKTFIAAVVMFNYWRWFPNSKIIFMAPTRPLVDQQIEACFYICGLPQSDTCDLTGSTSPAARRDLWKKKRVFFATPQTVQKDIISNTCPAEQVVCVVVDEAHKATGNYAYSEVVRRIAKKNEHFRVLALTATPGSNLDAVQDVISNLRITNVQIRTEESMDIREFSHGKNIQNVIVRLDYTEGASGDLPALIARFRDNVFKPLLLDLSKKPTNVTPDPDQWSPFRLRSSRTYFTTTSSNLNRHLVFQIVSIFLVAESVSRAYELLCQHGVAPFVESLENTLEELEEKVKSGKNMTFPQKNLYNNAVVKSMLQELNQKMQRPDFIGHPKMEKLLSILLSHFGNLENGQASKVMIFSSFRSSVMDICRVLERHQPMVRATYFVGQATGKKGKGLRQAEQQEIIQKFKSNNYNVIVSTSIGEEGLDIGEVDLIICYDSQTSPIRMLQRMGRTGRQRRGKCILLMTESEEKKFAQAKDAYSKIQRLIAQPGMITYHRPNPVVIPAGYRPVISKQVLNIGAYQPKLTGTKRKRQGGRDRSIISAEGKLTEMGKTILLNSFSTASHRFTEIDDIFSRYWPIQSMIKSLNRYVPLQIQEKGYRRIGHSQRTTEFVKLVQRMEHRILNPGQDVPFKAPEKRQTKLILPKKSVKKKKQPHDSFTINDDDFQEFIENNDISHFIHTEDNYQSGLILPKKRMRLDRSLDEPFDRLDHQDSKGKSKAVEQENEDGDITSGHSWESILPSSIYEDPLPQTQLPKQGQSSKSGVADQENSGRPQKSEETETMMVMNDNKVAHKEPSDIEFGDIDLDDDIELLSEAPQLFAKQEQVTPKQEQLVIQQVNSVSYDGYFDEYLAPKFPFESNLSDYGITATTTTTAFIWTSTVPDFTTKALQLLKERQINIKDITGRFVVMRALSEYSNSKSNTHTSALVNNIPSQTPSFDDDDEVNVELLMAMPDRDMIDRKPQANTAVEGNESNPVCLDEREEDDVDEFDFGLFSDLDEMHIASLIENRIDDELPALRPFDAIATAEPRKIDSQKSKAFLYYSNNDTIKENDQETKVPDDIDHKAKPVSTDHSTIEDEDDEVITFDFENMAQDISQSSCETASTTHPEETLHSSPLESTRRPQQPPLPINDDGNDNERSSHSRQSSSSLLMQLSTGQCRSPLRNHVQPSNAIVQSPLRNTIESTDEESPLIVYRRRKRIIREDSIDEPDIVTKKQKLTIPESSQEDEVSMSTTRQEPLLQRLKATSTMSHKHKYTEKERIGNPFIDDEAERSSDGGHTTDDNEEEGASSNMDSFIVDDACSSQSRQSVDENIDQELDQNIDIYRQSLIHHDVLATRDMQPMFPRNEENKRRHWLDRINLDKYNGEEDDETIEETEDSIIEEFSSEIAPKDTIQISDDDFM